MPSCNEICIKSKKMRCPKINYQPSLIFSILDAQFHTLGEVVKHLKYKAQTIKENRKSWKLSCHCFEGDNFPSILLRVHKALGRSRHPADQGGNNILLVSLLCVLIPLVCQTFKAFLLDCREPTLPKFFTQP